MFHVNVSALKLGRLNVKCYSGISVIGVKAHLVAAITRLLSFFFGSSVPKICNYIAWKWETCIIQTDSLVYICSWIARSFNNYLTNHKICVAPVECKVADDASLELLHQLYKQRVSIQFGVKECIDILLTSFWFPGIIGGQLAELRTFSSVCKSYLPCCMHEGQGN